MMMLGKEYRTVYDQGVYEEETYPMTLKDKDDHRWHVFYDTTKECGEEGFLLAAKDYDEATHKYAEAEYASDLEKMIYWMLFDNPKTAVY